MRFDIQVHLKSYIAHPYWPEMERVITIQKESGMNRARSAANRRKALEEYLHAEGMSLVDYDRLVELANRPFHADNNGKIVIPKANVEAMLVSVCDTARSATRPCAPEQVRSLIQVTAWHTNRVIDDALMWERYAVVSSGTGAKLSNQRGLRRNSYIGAEPPADVPPTDKVMATGTMEVLPDMVKPEILKRALEYGGVWVGIGASRKMGWGRFELMDWAEAE